MCVHANDPTRIGDGASQLAVRRGALASALGCPGVERTAAARSCSAIGTTVRADAPGPLLGDGVQIADGVTFGAGVVVHDATIIGEGCSIEDHAVSASARD